MDDDGPLPLSGVRVLDLTRVLAGPFCTMILADLGAEVVKIERPKTGDDSRHFPPFLPSGLSGYFASINRGKKSVALDLKRDTDRATFLRLVERADAVVENFRPGTMESLGLGAETLRRMNPRLVYASASGFGRDGQHGKRPAYDIIIQAMSGIMSVTGPGPGHFVRVGTSITDIVTGLFTAVGVLASLLKRERDGVGADLDMAMLDCAVAVLENALARYEATGEPPEPLGARHPSITPFEAFETKDTPIVIAAGNDALFEKLCQALDAPELPDDPRFATNPQRTHNHDLLAQELAARLRQRPAAEWLAMLEAAGVPCAPIRNMAEVAADEHLRERGMLHPVEDWEGHVLLTAGSPIRVNGGSLPLSRHAPSLGEHTDAVIKEWLS